MAEFDYDKLVIGIGPAAFVLHGLRRISVPGRGGGRPLYG